MVFKKLVAALAASAALSDAEPVSKFARLTSPVAANSSIAHTAVADVVTLTLFTSTVWVDPPTAPTATTIPKDDISLVWDYSQYSTKKPPECKRRWHKKHKNFFNGARKYPEYCKDERPSLGNAVAKFAGCWPHFTGSGCAAIAMSRYAPNPTSGCPGVFSFVNDHSDWVVSPKAPKGCKLPVMPECVPERGRNPKYCQMKMYQQAMMHMEASSCVSKHFEGDGCESWLE